ncbi:MAG: hypothetical protein M3298_01730 [Thermoproteota archaeon]|nr:hypothetical protein [Thermoproteota archaeon]
MSDDNNKRNSNRGSAIFIVVGMLGCIAAMIWYNLFAYDRRRKKLFKKMKYYQSRSLEEMV